MRCWLPGGGFALPAYKTTQWCLTGKPVGKTTSEWNIVVEIHWWFVRRCRSGLLLRTRLRAAAELVAALRLLRLTPATLLLLTATRWCATALTATQHLHGATNVDHDASVVCFSAPD